MQCLHFVILRDDESILLCGKWKTLKYDRRRVNEEIEYVNDDNHVNYFQNVGKREESFLDFPTSSQRFSS